MAAINYQNLLNLITGLAPNADEAAKKNVLTQVSDALIIGQEPDGRLRLRAIGTRASLQYAPQGMNMDGWIRAELAQYIEDFVAKGAVLPQQDVNMAVDGGRKRRYRKRTRKTKKQTTRRR